MREGLLFPDQRPAKGMSRINPFPTTDAQRKRPPPEEGEPPQLFKPTVRAVKEIVPNKMIPPLG